MNCHGQFGRSRQPLTRRRARRVAPGLRHRKRLKRAIERRRIHQLFARARFRAASFRSRSASFATAAACRSQCVDSARSPASASDRPVRGSAPHRLPARRRNAPRRRAAPLARQWIASCRQCAISGSVTLSSKCPSRPHMHDGLGEALHVEANLHEHLTHHRVDFPRHDRRTGLRRGQPQFAEARARARAEQPDIVRDFGQARGDRRQRAGDLDAVVARALGFEMVGRLAKRRARSPR